MCNHPVIAKVSKHKAICTQCGKTFAPNPTWCEVIITLALIAALAVAISTV